MQQRTLTGRSAIRDSRSTHNPTNQGTKRVRQPACKDCVLRSWVAARRAAQARVHRKLQRAKSGRAKAYGGGVVALQAILGMERGWNMNHTQAGTHPRGSAFYPTPTE